jgi:hypothetical protein
MNGVRVRLQFRVSFAVVDENGGRSSLHIVRVDASGEEVVGGECVLAAGQMKETQATQESMPPSIWPVLKLQKRCPPGVIRWAALASDTLIYSSSDPRQSIEKATYLMPRSLERRLGPTQNNAPLPRRILRESRSSRVQ